MYDVAIMRYILGTLLFLYATTLIFFVMDCRNSPDSCSGEIYLIGLAAMAATGGLALFRDSARIGYSIAMIFGLLGLCYSLAFYALGSTDTILQPETYTIVFPSFFVVFGFTFTSSAVGLVKKFRKN